MSTTLSQRLVYGIVLPYSEALRAAAGAIDGQADGCSLEPQSCAASVGCPWILHVTELAKIRGQLALKDREIERLDEEVDCARASREAIHKVYLQYESMFGSPFGEAENPVMGVLNHMTTYFRHVRLEYGTRFFNTVLKTALLASEN